MPLNKIDWKLPQGWSTFFLAWAMVLIAGFAIYQANLTQGLEVLMLIGSFGYISGFFLARSAFSHRTAALFSITYGGFAIIVLLSLYFLPTELTWAERTSEIIGQQIDWIEKLFSGGTNRNPLVFALHTAVIFWVFGHTAAWYTFRALRIWRVILPSGILLLSVVYYYYGPEPLVLYMALYLIVAMLYISRTYLAEQEQVWRATAVRYDRHTTFNFLRAGLGLALFGLFIAWQLPAMSASAAVNDALGGVNRPWRDFQDNWTRLYSSLRSYGGGVNDPYAGSLPLGGPRNVGESLVMDVFVPERLPYAYWVSTVFETYEDGQWTVPEGDRIVYIPDDGLANVPLTASRNLITQTIRNYMPNTGVVFGMPDVVGSDRQMFVTQQFDDLGKSLISQNQSRYVLQQGDVYEAYSQISTADVASLRAASQFYPDYIDPYLQLDDRITPETLALAQELAAPHDNPYDIAIAIRDYLRRTIIYNDQIDAPPNDVEPVHYILFELQEGYCNYYASAMAVMLRSLGIPARVSAGFASGQFIEDAGVYRVRASDAHTWVEAYFPDYGWIQFEPTAAITIVNRPVGEAGDDLFEPGFVPPEFPDRDDQLPEDDFLDPNDRLDENDPNFEADAVAPTSETAVLPFGLDDPVRLFRTILGLLVLILAGVALYLGNHINQRIEGDVGESYGRLSKWGGWLGHAPLASQTPYERAERLTTAVPEGRQPIRNLTHAYVEQNFSPQQNSDIHTAAEWRTLRPMLLRKAIANWWQNRPRLRLFRR